MNYEQGNYCHFNIHRSKFSCSLAAALPVRMRPKKTSSSPLGPEDAIVLCRTILRPVGNAVVPLFRMGTLWAPLPYCDHYATIGALIATILEICQSPRADRGARSERCGWFLLSIWSVWFVWLNQTDQINPPRLPRPACLALRRHGLRTGS